MTKYNIEGNINFYDELYKSLNENDNENEEKENIINDDKCLITGLPLTDNFITLECNHKFNYNALYTEIYNQKFKFRTYSNETLNKNDIQKIKQFNKNYYIKCPYCRNIQTTLLPYYENMNYSKVYGINSDNVLDNKYKICNNNSFTYNTYTKWGYTFANSQFQCAINGCKCIYLSLLPETNKYYCSTHIRKALKEHIITEKNKHKEEKLQKKEQLKQQKEELKKQKEELKKQKEDLKKQKEELKKQKEDLKKEEEKNIITNTCSCILKTGQNKGKPCGIKKIFQDNLCKRHYKLYLTI
jgi:hypothetical protein